MKKKKTDLVVKSNRLIEASYRLGLIEQRIILYAVCRSREDQSGLFHDLPVTITAEDFLKRFPSMDKAHVYGQLKDAMDALYDRSVTYADTDPDTGMYRANKTRWISRASYIDGAGRIQIVFTEDVIKHIHRLETEFTTYDLEKVSRMTSAHAVRLYEMLAQHKDLGKRSIRLVLLRHALQLNDDEYKLTADLKKWVLDAAVKQITDHTDLTISYEPRKTGRAITDFDFKIKVKSGLKDDGKKAKAKAATPADQAARDALEAKGQQRLIEHFTDDNNEEF